MPNGVSQISELFFERPTRTDYESSSNRDLSLKLSRLCRGGHSGDPKGGMGAGRLGFALQLLFLGAIALRPVPLLTEQPIPSHRLNRLERQSDYSQQVEKKSIAATISDILDFWLLHRSPLRPETVPPDYLSGLLADLASGCVSLAPHPPPARLSKSRCS
jgi:hypothetical protein